MSVGYIDPIRNVEMVPATAVETADNYQRLIQILVILLSKETDKSVTITEEDWSRAAFELMELRLDNPNPTEMVLSLTKPSPKIRAGVTYIANPEIDHGS